MREFPTRKGLRLCSHQNPEGQAQAWLQEIRGSLAPTNFVLGIGAGFHVQALRRKFPESRFVVLDFDVKLAASLEPSALVRSEILSETFNAAVEFENLVLPHLTEGYRVLSFRPSWAGLETGFQRLEKLLLGQIVDGNPLIQMDLDLMASLENVDERFQVNIRSLVEQESNLLSPALKKLRALRELVS